MRIGKRVPEADRLAQRSGCACNAHELAVVLQAAPHDDPQVASPLAPVGAGSKSLYALGNDGGKLVEGFKSAGKLSPGAGELRALDAALT